MGRKNKLKLNKLKDALSIFDNQVENAGIEVVIQLDSKEKPYIRVNGFSFTAKDGKPIFVLLPAETIHYL